MLLLSSIFTSTEISSVVPIFKSGSSKVVVNYRPLSVLHTVSKILEKIMKRRVSDFLDRENIIRSNQYGLRSGLSTTDAILELTDKCAENLNDKLYTIAVSLDLSKAFDTVNKSIMIMKLNRLGFKGAIAD